MNQPLFIVSLVCFCSMDLAAQPLFVNDTVPAYFNEIKEATRGRKDLWNYDLYAPILLVNPGTRETFANSPDTAGALKMVGSVFTGFLPKSVNIANTTLDWNGVHWAMVMLPLPDDKYDRLDLLAHELFHRAQTHLGFLLFNPDNNHLDLREGRVWLRLELAALKGALLAPSREEAEYHLTNALAFRKYRHALFPGADSTENLLELNEGLAEYTGLMTSGRGREQVQSHLVRSQEKFLTNPTFVRSFAYQTIPVYGYLLYAPQQDWNKQITASTDLTEFFLRAFMIHLPRDMQHFAVDHASEYGGETIVAEETARETEMKRQAEEYTSTFVERPHLTLRVQNMSLSFDPRAIVPLGKHGMVYPRMRVTDTWGILTVTGGALLSPNWSSITVSMPTQVSEDSAAGKGWTLELHKPFLVREDSTGGNYSLIKR